MCCVLVVVRCVVCVVVCCFDCDVCVECVVRCSLVLERSPLFVVY